MTIKKNTMYHLYSKDQKPDDNTEYTIKKYKVGERIAELWPEFTKILVNPSNDILAYIDVRMIPEQKNINSKYGSWFGIQEFHPELIGDFTLEINWNTDPSTGGWYGSTWKHETNKNLYTFNMSKDAETVCFLAAYHKPMCYGSPIQINPNWYEIMDKKIKTNIGLIDTSITYTYPYETHPSVVPEHIKTAVSPEVLKSVFEKRHNKIKDFIQRRK